MRTSEKALDFIMSIVIFLIPNIIFTQTTITVDSVSFPAYTSGDSGFTNYTAQDKDVITGKKQHFQPQVWPSPSAIESLQEQ